MKRLEERFSPFGPKGLQYNFGRIEYPTDTSCHPPMHRDYGGAKLVEEEEEEEEHATSDVDEEEEEEHVSSDVEEEEEEEHVSSDVDEEEEEG